MKYIIELVEDDDTPDTPRGVGFEVDHYLYNVLLNMLKESARAKKGSVKSTGARV